VADRPGQRSTGLARPTSPASPRTGNRFDSPDGTFAVLYFGTTLRACFGETLARFRPTPALAELVGDEWDRMAVMSAGQLAADWRHRRTAVRAQLPTDSRYLDVDSGRTLDVLRAEQQRGQAGRLRPQPDHLSPQRGQFRLHPRTVATNTPPPADPAGVGPAGT